MTFSDYTVHRYREEVQAHLYLLTAVQEFRDTIWRRVRGTLHGACEDLVAAAGVPVEIVGDHEDWGFDEQCYCVMAAKLRLGGAIRGYFGVMWGGPNLDDPDDIRAIAVLTAASPVPRTHLREIVFSRIENSSATERIWPGAASLSVPLARATASELQRELEGLISAWAEALHAGGGLGGSVAA